MPIHRGGLLRDRRGISSIAVGALVSIAVLLFYLQFISTLQGAEVAFWGIFGFLKWLAVVIGDPHLFDDFEKLIKDLQGTPFWPITVYMLSLAFMSGILWGMLWGTKGIVGMTTRILAWRGARREEKRKIREKNKKEYKLWKKRLEGGEKRQSIILPKVTHKSKRPKLESTSQIEKIKTKSWESQDWKKLVILEWWQIPKIQVLTLVEGKIQEIIVEVRKLFPTKKSPQGSYEELEKTLGMDAYELRKTAKGARDTITVGNLIKLLDKLELPYSTLTPYIKAVGGGGNEAIVNPKFPFNMYCPEGARLLAAALKDGHIEKDRHRFKYTNYDPENLRIVTEAVQNIVGDVKPFPIYDLNGRQSGIQFGSVIIGEMLLKAGAVEGRKTEQDYHLPYMVKYGDYSIKNAYFEHAIRDDGSIDYRIRLSNAHEIESKMSPEHRSLIEHIHLKKTRLPSGRIEHYANLKEGLQDDLPIELRPVYEDFLLKIKDEWVPKNIIEEKEIIEKTYNVKARIVLNKIYKGERGLRGEWNIIVKGKEDVNRMVSQLGSVWEKGGGE